MIGMGLSSNAFEKKNPYQFNFTNVNNVNPNTVQTLSITPTGYDGPVTVFVIAGGGSVRKNSTGFYGTSIILFPGDILNIQMSSSSTYNSTLTTTIMMGTISTTWSVTTLMVTPGNQNYTIPGTYSFTVPAYNTINITVYGSGGGASSEAGRTNSIHYNGVPGGTGGTSSFGPYLSATGGQGGSTINFGTPVTGGNGVGSGGNIANDSNGPAGGVDNFNSSGFLGSGIQGGSGGVGGRSISTYTSTLTIGSIITVTVGIAGPGGVGTNDTDVGGNGQTGSVIISWS